MYLRLFISVGMIHLGMAVWYRVAKHNTLHWDGNFNFSLFCHQNVIVGPKIYIIQKNKSNVKIVL